MSFGNTLRTERERRRLTLDVIAKATKIGSGYLLALEAEDLDRLPGGIYNRGFLRGYAEYLKLDPAPLVADLNALMESPTQSVLTPERAAQRALRKAPTR